MVTSCDCDGGTQLSTRMATNSGTSYIVCPGWPAPTPVSTMMPPVTVALSTTTTPVSASSATVTSKVAIVWEREIGLIKADFWDAWAYNSSWAYTYCDGVNKIATTSATVDGTTMSIETPHPATAPALPPSETMLLGDLPGGQTACQYSNPDSNGGYLECGTGLPQKEQCSNAFSPLNEYEYVTCNNE